MINEKIDLIFTYLPAVLFVVLVIYLVLAEIGRVGPF